MQKCSIYIPNLGCLVNQPDILHAVVLWWTCSPLKSSDRCNINNGLVCNYHVTHLTPKAVLSGLVLICLFSLFFCAKPPLSSLLMLLFLKDLYCGVSLVFLSFSRWSLTSLWKNMNTSKGTHHPFIWSSKPLPFTKARNTTLIGSNYELI